MQFKYGEPISLDLSNLLREFTDKTDRANVSIKTGVSMSTIRDVTYMNNSVTADNSKAIIELMKIAVKNCTNRIEYAKKAREEFKNKYLPAS